MALFSCPECGAMISDKATACPHCGYPIEADKQTDSSTVDKENTNQVTFVCGHGQYRSKFDRWLFDVPTNDDYRGVIEQGFSVTLLDYDKKELKKASLSSFAELEMPFGNRFSMCFGFDGLEEAIANKVSYILVEGVSPIQSEKKQSLNDTLNERLEAQKRRLHTLENIPDCPNCGSYDVKRISTASRLTSVFAVGLASSKIGKQYKCNKCKHMW